MSTTFHILYACTVDDQGGRDWRLQNIHHSTVFFVIITIIAPDSFGQQSQRNILRVVDIQDFNHIYCCCIARANVGRRWLIDANARYPAIKPFWWWSKGQKQIEDGEDGDGEKIVSLRSYKCANAIGRIASIHGLPGARACRCTMYVVGGLYTYILVTSSSRLAAAAAGKTVDQQKSPTGMLSLSNELLPDVRKRRTFTNRGYKCVCPVKRKKKNRRRKNSVRSSGEMRHINNLFFEQLFRGCALIDGRYIIIT